MSLIAIYSLSRVFNYFYHAPDVLTYYINFNITSPIEYIVPTASILVLFDENLVSFQAL